MSNNIGKIKIIDDSKYILKILCIFREKEKQEEKY